MRTRILALVATLAAVLTSACSGGDKPAVPSTGSDSAMAASLATLKSRTATADSLVKSAPTMPAVVTKLGAKAYDVADPALTAAVLKEAEKTKDCYTNALKNYDPNLSVVFYMLVNFGAAGWDLVRVEDRTMSSNAGGAVETCINMRAKKEWKLPTTGIKPGAHLVKLVYRPDSVGAADSTQKK